MYEIKHKPMFALPKVTKIALRIMLKPDVIRLFAEYAHGKRPSQCDRAHGWSKGHTRQILNRNARHIRCLNVSDAAHVLIREGLIQPPEWWTAN